MAPKSTLPAKRESKSMKFISFAKFDRLVVLEYELNAGAIVKLLLRGIDIVLSISSSSVILMLSSKTKIMYCVFPFKTSVPNSIIH